MYDVEQLRRTEFPLTATETYLNHAGLSPLPERSRHAIQQSVDRFAANPHRHNMHDAEPMNKRLHAALATLINAASPDEIQRVANTSMGINMLAQGLGATAGDNIVLCDVEFPANVYPWMSLQKKDGLEVRLVPSDNLGLTVERLAPYVDTNTKLVAVSAVQFFSGHRSDLTALGKFCHERGILFSVDAIQASGHIPIDVQAMHIDMLISGGQKSLLSPMGTGFLYVRESLANQMSPRIIACDATQDFLKWLEYDITPLPAAGRFSTSTQNTSGMFGMLASVELITELGIHNIDAYTHQLAAETMHRMQQRGFDILTPADAHSAIVTFKVSDSVEKTDALVKFADEKHVTFGRHLSRQGVPYLRVSFHCYNNEQDIDHLERVIGEYNL